MQFCVTIPFTPYLEIVDIMMMVSFDPTSYTVVEGTDPTAELMLVRSGDLSRSVVVEVFTNPGTAGDISCDTLHMHKI